MTEFHTRHSRERGRATCMGCTLCTLYIYIYSRDGHGLGSVAMHSAHHCSSFNVAEWNSGASSSNQTHLGYIDL